MCCGGTSTTTSSNIPEWIEGAGKDVWAKAKSFYESPYQSYTGQRQAPFNADQQAAFSAVRNQFANRPQVGAEALDLTRQAATAPARELSTERIIDEGGRLGSIDSYMNQHLDRVLNPQIRELNRQADVERLRIGDIAQGSGGYGDARHGVMESSLNRDLMQTVGDVTGRAYFDAFNNAMGLRSGDLDRFGTTDMANANLYETALGRTMAGGAQLPAIAGADQNNFLTALNALLGSGSLQQQHEQTGLDIPYTEFEKQQQDRYDRMAALVSVLGQTPYPRQTVTTENNGMGGLFGALGSLLGGFLG